MNERIKQLVAQAESYAYEHEEHWHAGPDWQELFNEKFAELIIRECAEVSFKHWEKHKGCSAHFSIREHFGVKE